MDNPQDNNQGNGAIAFWISRVLGIPESTAVKLMLLLMILMTVLAGFAIKQVWSDRQALNEEHQAAVERPEAEVMSKRGAN